MRKPSIFIDNRRIDLFQDEKISVKSSVQDIADISKVFTDFSQTFSVPASDENNDILGFYYNNDLGEFNANIRVAARIEIDNTPFREGKMQLEGSTIKDGQVESYKISFFGDVVTLKDRFSQDKLSDLDFSGLSFTYNGANVQNTITDTSYLDVRFPLISSSRVWQYNTGGLSADDIYNSNNGIKYSELFPAVSDAKIMELIASTYNVTFSGGFLSDDRLKNSFTWWKNRNLDTNGSANFTTKSVDLTFNSGGSVLNPNLVNNPVAFDSVTIEYIDMSLFSVPFDWGSWIGMEYQKIDVYVSPSISVGSNYYFLDVYKNGVLNQTYEGTFGSSLYNVMPWSIIPVGTNDIYTFKARSANGGYNLNCDIRYSFKANYLKSSGGIGVIAVETATASSVVAVLSTQFDFNTTAPDMKVSDWFSGTLKEFNLTCYPLSKLDTFQIEPLNDWYSGGEHVDITQFVDTKTIKVDRAKLYNELSFEFSKSKSFMNEAFSDIHSREYGNLKEVFPDYDGGKYSVKLPFETLLFNNFDDINNNLQVGYSLTTAPDYKPYIPKAVKLYLHTSKSCSFFFDNGTTAPNLTSYMPFGQDTEFNTKNYSMNFGSEVSSLLNITNENSLYNTYYQQYLVNLFNPKTRIVTVQAILPIDILTRLTLDDAIIIRDKKYRINDMTTDLNSGVVRFVLISDWVKTKARFQPPVDIESGGGDVVYNVKPTKGGKFEISAPIETPFITSTPSLPATLTDEVNVVIDIPSNNTGVKRTQTIQVTKYRSNGEIDYTDYIYIEQKAESFNLLLENGGSLLTENLDKILL